MQIAIVLAVVLLLIFALSKNLARPAYLFAAATGFFYLTGFIPYDAVAKNILDEAPVTVALLVTVCAVLDKTNLVLLLRRLTNGDGRARTLGLFSLSAFISAFVNNTIEIALYLRILRDGKKAAQKLLPLSYLLTVAGTATLLGTSTNFIVAGFARNAGLKEIHLFDFAYVGVPVSIAALFYLFFFSKKLLPHAGELQEKAELSYFVEAVVRPGSKLIGRSVQANGLRNLEALFLAEVLRDKELISPVSPYELIQAGDILVFAGDIANVKDLQRFDGLDLFSERHEILQNNLVRVILAQSSDLVGETIKEANFRNRFDAAVIAVRRGQERLSGKLGTIRLQAGDHLVLAVGNDFRKSTDLEENFYLITDLQLSNPLAGWRSAIASLGFLALVLAVAAGAIPLLRGVVVLGGLYLGFRLLSADEFRRNLPLDLILLIGSALAIADVIVRSGTAAWFADGILSKMAGAGPFATMAVLYGMSVVLTQILTNNAACALTLPFALASAKTLGVNPMPFLMAVAYGASASFLTPYGYQVNVMVYSTGLYSAKDFARLGFPLLLLYSAIVLALTPIFFPF